MSEMQLRHPGLSELIDVQLTPADITTAVVATLGPYNRWSLYIAAMSQGKLTFTGQPLNTETVVIDTKTYTFQTTLTDTDGNVLIGGTTEASIDNLVAAINLASGSGTTYAASMIVHPTAQASKDSSTVLRAIAKTQGLEDLATTETLTNGSWDGATFDAVVDTVDITVRLTAGGSPATTREFYELPGSESPITVDEGDEDIVEFGYTTNAIQVTANNNTFVRVQVRGVR